MLIGLIGGKGAGKTTVSNYLTQSSHNFKPYAFADPLKLLCKHLFGLNDHQLDGRLKEVIDPRWGVSPRTLYQKIGTEMFRKHLKAEIPELECNNIWIKKFELWMQENKGDNIVVTDCRFEDEIQAVQKHNGVIILVERETLSNDAHASEQIYKTFQADAVIKNDKDLNSLYHEIDKILGNF